MQNKKLNTVPPSFQEVTGPIDVTLRNDMLFHRVMELSNSTLKGLICSLKGLNPDDVKEVTVLNPIDYSASVGKEIILDVKVLMNSNELLDIELQLYHFKEWEKRSLLYMCRTFDSIGTAENYSQLKPTTFIAIMDNPLFPEHPEFYSHYQFLNTKTHQPYSTLLGINVLYLKQIERATKEDKANGLVYWARLFQTTTWEDLKKLVREKPEFEEVAKIMYNSNLVQSQEKTLYEAHQKFIGYQNDLYESGYADAKEADKKEIDELTSKNEALVSEKAELVSEIAQLKEKLAKAGIPVE